MVKILRFPTRSEHFHAAADQVAALTSSAWAEARLPILAAGFELLGLSDTAFARRIASMQGQEGLGLVAELVHELEQASLDLERMYRASYLARTRLRSALCSLEQAEAHP